MQGKTKKSVLKTDPSATIPTYEVSIVMSFWPML